jgi:hypothetical protein
MNVPDMKSLWEKLLGIPPCEDQWEFWVAMHSHNDLLYRRKTISASQDRKVERPVEPNENSAIG